MLRFLWILLPCLLAAFSIPSGTICTLQEAIASFRRGVISHFLCLITGIALGALARYLLYLRSSVLPNGYDDGLRNTVYGLDHGRLNVQLPPPTIWMNMGYWEVRLFYSMRDCLIRVQRIFLKNTADFPSACQALLEEVLISANLLQRKDNSLCTHQMHSTTLLDLGFGCGAQSLYLMKTPVKKLCQTKDFEFETVPMPLFNRYIGITLDQRQFRYAKNCLVSCGIVNDPDIQIFQADAAKPATWSTELVRTINQNSATIVSSSYLIPLDSTKQTQGCWVLALDTLYHFSPSRQQIFNYSHSELNASIMAFDILVADDTTLLNQIALSAVAIFMGCPRHTFVKAQKYREMLVTAGYQDHNIEIKDVSTHVFEPLSEFLTEREKVLKAFGWGLGKLKAAKWLFGWWASTKIVRGVIIVARK